MPLLLTLVCVTVIAYNVCLMLLKVCFDLHFNQHKRHNFVVISYRMVVLKQLDHQAHVLVEPKHMLEFTSVRLKGIFRPPMRLTKDAIAKMVAM